MQNVDENEWKKYPKEKCSLKIIQNIVKNEWKR